MGSKVSIDIVTQGWETYAVGGATFGSHNWLVFFPYDCHAQQQLRDIHRLNRCTCFLLLNHFPSTSSSIKWVINHLNHIPATCGRGGGPCIVWIMNSITGTRIWLVFFLILMIRSSVVSRDCFLIMVFFKVCFFFAFLFHLQLYQELSLFTTFPAFFSTAFRVISTTFFSFISYCTWRTLAFTASSLVA